MLKHSAAAHLLSAGADLLFVHEWLGHTMLQSTAIYLYLVAPSSQIGIPHKTFLELP